MRQVIIIGSGPAGYTAAIYAARANLDPLLIASSVEFGGELMKTTEVENFPGFPEGIMGPDLMVKMQEQAERFGTEIVYDDVVKLELDGDVKRVTLGNGDVHEALTVIYATGSAYRKLGLDDETRLSGYGVSWCATCDGAFFKQKKVAVIGGGDSALEEATFLTRFADKVYLVHRRDSCAPRPRMQDRAFADPKIEFLWNSEVAHIYGDEKVAGIGLRRHRSRATETTLDVSGMFVAIGADPRTHLVHGQLDLTPEGTIAVDGRSSRTNLPGVFAAGDVIDPTYKQAATAAGSGVVAALDAEHYLAEPRRGLAQATRDRRRHRASREWREPRAVLSAGLRKKETMSTAKDVTDATFQSRGARLREADHGRLLGGMVRPVSRGLADPRRDRRRARRQDLDRQAQRRRQPRDGDEVRDHLDPRDEGLPGGEVVKTRHRRQAEAGPRGRPRRVPGVA